MTDFDYDLIAVGGGSGGVRAARFAASRHGVKAAVIESTRIGGTCVMRGCVPKKLLVHGARFADDFEDARGYGWTPGRPAFDWSALIRNKDAELERLEGVYHRLLREAGVDEITGRGRLIDNHTVEVNGARLTARYIILCMGGWPHLPDIPGVEHVITSNEALDLPELPQRIVIAGGGYIAVEFAGIFNALGSEVHLVIRGDQILRGFDSDVRLALRGEMEKRGVWIHSERRISSIEPLARGGYSLRLDPARTPQTDGTALETDRVMYATGRRPNTGNAGLEEAGVALNENGAVIVDGNYKTSLDAVYAIGDVTDRVQLTPVALAEGAALVEHLFGGGGGKVDYRNIPTAVFSQPPLGTVGMTEEEARGGHGVKIFRSRFRPMKHTLSGRDEMTMMKMIVCKDTDRVLGCHMVGADAPEMTQGLGVAMKCGATKAQFDATIGIHPTGAEEWVTMRDPVAED